MGGPNDDEDETRIAPSRALLSEDLDKRRLTFDPNPPRAILQLPPPAPRILDPRPAPAPASQRQPGGFQPVTRTVPFPQRIDAPRSAPGQDLVILAAPPPPSGDLPPLVFRFLIVSGIVTALGLLALIYLSL